MKNKLLLLVVLMLLPIAIFLNNKEGIDNKESQDIDTKIVVNLNKNDENIRMSFNDYLIGVVGQEMPASFSFEALKAQAVAARTFAYNYIINNEIYIKDSAQHYINIDEMKNKWNNDYETYYNKIKDAVLETDREVIMYDNKLIRSYYYAISNGKSEDSIAVFNEELPYLKVVDSSFDEKVKNFEATTYFSYENFCLLLNITPCNVNIVDIKRDNSSRVSIININGKELSGTDVRRILSLRSTDFTIDLLDNNIKIKTKGYGHGVGMSQYGANYLANNGYNYQEILKYYYMDVEITKI